MRATSPIEERIVALVEPDAEALGYRLVRVRLMGNRRRTLQIMAERASDGLFSPKDCSRLSRRAAELLEEIEYEALEVSSPGIDRPLMRLEDFARFQGHEAKIETAAMIDGRKRFKGVIAGVEGDKVRLKLADSEIEAVLPFASLSDARLVLTDRLIEEDLRRAKAAEKEEEKRKPQ